MSDIPKCGFCGLLSGFLRRFMCTGNRRGSRDSCYRELGEQDDLQFDGRSDTSNTSSCMQEVFSPAAHQSASGDNLTPAQRKTFLEEMYVVLQEEDDEEMNWYRGWPTGMFHSFKRRRIKSVPSSHRDEDVVLDTYYPLHVELLLSRCARWNFDTIYLDRATGGRCLPILCMHLFTGYGLIEFFKLLPESCWKLFHSIEACYHASNPYHNSVHAADVTQAMHCFLQEPPLKSLSQLEVMVVLLAAITHDIDHPGVNHSFLVATNHPLAMMFRNHELGSNDQSPLPQRAKKARRLQEMIITLRNANESFSPLEPEPYPTQRVNFFKKKKSSKHTTPCESLLEHHHWRAAYSVILESGIFNHMQESLPAIQRMLKSLILATDITRQNDYLNVFKDHLHHKTLDMDRPDHRHMVLQMALKTADISNPGRPWAISRKWSHSVCDEFYQQGDKELKLNLKVSNLCDRQKDTVPKIQTGFFRFVVTPLFTEWHHYLKSDLSRTMLTNLVHNEAEWAREDRRASQTSKSMTYSDLNKISDADQVEKDLETSTYISKSTASFGTEELTALIMDKACGRRASHSPVKESKLKEIIRRYSIPIGLLDGSSKNPSILEFTLKRLAKRRSTPNADGPSNASPVPPVPQVQVEDKPLIEPCSTRHTMPGYTVHIDSDDDDDLSSSVDKGDVGTVSVIIEESSMSSSSGRGVLLSARQGLLSDITSDSNSDGNLERQFEEDANRQKVGGRRRGSAPAPGAFADLQRFACELSHHLHHTKHSASCHQWVSEPPAAAARRGSLPVEESPPEMRRNE